MIMEYVPNNAPFIRDNLSDLHNRFNEVKDQTIERRMFGEVDKAWMRSPAVSR